MATLPRYGGTNGVTELDIGQPGGGLHPTTARATLRMSMRQPAGIVTVQNVPQQSIGFHDVQGPGRAAWQWQGRIKVAAAADLRTIRSNLEQAWHGHSVLSTGRYGTFTAAEIAATALVDGLGVTVAADAKLTGYTLGQVDRITGDGTYSYIMPVRVFFVVLS